MVRATYLLNSAQTRHKALGLGELRPEGIKKETPGPAAVGEAGKAREKGETEGL